MYATDLKHDDRFRFADPETIFERVSRFPTPHDISHGEWQCELQHLGSIARCFARPTGEQRHLWRDLALPLLDTDEVLLVEQP